MISNAPLKITVQCCDFKGAFLIQKVGGLFSEQRDRAKKAMSPKKAH